MFIERVGTFDPMLAKDHANRLKLNTERVQHWLKMGATPSDRVARLLHGVGLGEKPAVPVQTKQNQPKAKAQERIKAAEEAAKAAAEAAAKPAADEAAAG